MMSGTQGSSEADNLEQREARLVFINSFKYSAFWQTMSDVSKKRTLDAFFKPPAKKIKTEDGVVNDGKQNPPSQDRVSPQVSQVLTDNLMEKILDYSKHRTYPFHIACFPEQISSQLQSLPSTTGKTINDQAHLDLIYFQPYTPKSLQRNVFQFLRKELPFYRVEYDIKRGGIETHIKTPRSDNDFLQISLYLFSQIHNSIWSGRDFRIQLGRMRSRR